MRDLRDLRDLTALPKAHLHVHLEAGVGVELVRRLRPGWRPPPPRYASFAAFVAAYDELIVSIARPDDLRAVVHDVVREARRDGAWWVEPAAYLPVHRALLGSDEAALELVLDALGEAARDAGLGAGLIVQADRTRPPEEAVELARLAARYAGRGVVAFGLANDELAAPAGRFEAAFAIARDAGLLSAPHAGETAGPESVQEAVRTLGARRIEHGITAVASPPLLELLADRDVCLDVCPSSNVALGLVDGVAAHPLAELVAAGVTCTVNADDPVLFGTTLSRELELCRSELALPDETLAALAWSSLRCSGAPDELKQRGRRAVDAWLGQ